MARDLVCDRTVHQEARMLPHGDYSLVDLIREVTGWRQIGLEALEGNMPALVQAFCQGCRAMACK